MTLTPDWHVLLTVPIFAVSYISLISLIPHPLSYSYPVLFLSLSFFHLCKHDSVETVWDMELDRSQFECQLIHMESVTSPEPQSPHLHNGEINIYLKELL